MGGWVVSESMGTGVWSPGWYLDAARTERGKRYWDGSGWTDDFEYPEPRETSASVFCEQCGNQVEPTAKFCASCGTAQPGAAEPTDGSSRPASDVQPGPWRRGTPPESPFTAEEPPPEPQLPHGSLPPTAPSGATATKAAAPAPPAPSAD